MEGNILLFSVGLFITCLAVFGLFYTKRELEEETNKKDPSDVEPADQDMDCLSSKSRSISKNFKPGEVVKTLKNEEAKIVCSYSETSYIVDINDEIQIKHINSLHY
jgi:hypothetical protein